MQHGGVALSAHKAAIEGDFMIFALFGRKKRLENQRIVASLYETLTSAARQPALYEAMDVPDTVMGRFEMLAAHVILFLRRTAAGDTAVQALGQEIVDEFFLDIDHSIRELGIGDMSVPKKMKKLGRMFYGRMRAYAEALSTGDDGAMADALRRNIHPNGEVTTDGMRLCAVYLAEADRRLALLDDAAIARGEISFPVPEAAARAGEPA